MVDRETYNNRHPSLMRNLHNPLKIRNIILWIPNALQVHRLRLVVNRSLEVLWLIPIDELSRNTEAGQQHFELVVCAAVQVGSGNDVVALVGERCEGHELGGLAGGGGDGGDSAFEGGDALFEDVDCGLYGEDMLVRCS